MANKPNIKIKKDEEKPEPMELLAKSIVEVADGFAKLERSPLNKRAIVLLLQDGIGAGKISKTQILLVLENLPKLKAWYIKPNVKGN